MLVGHSRQHDHGELGHVLGQPAHPPQLLQFPGVGQAQVEQHTRHLGQEWLRVAQGPRPAQSDRGRRVQQEFLDQQGIGVIVLDEQHLRGAGRGGRARRGRPGILSHRLTLFVIFVASVLFNRLGWASIVGRIGPVPLSRRTRTHSQTARRPALLWATPKSAPGQWPASNLDQAGTIRTRGWGRTPATAHGSPGSPAATALHELRRTGGHYALVTMCIGGGQGIAAILERV
jgi:hypothetical protein